MDYQWPPKARLQLYAFAVLMVLLYIMVCFVSENFLTTSGKAQPARDFIAFWATSKLSLAGTPVAAYDMKNIMKIIHETVGLERKFTWVYPPTFQIFVLPLSLLSYQESYVMAMVVTFIMFLYSGYKLAGSSADYILPLMAFPAVYLAMIYGQNSLLTAAICMMAMHSLDRQPVLAGVLVGVLYCKPQLSVLFPLALMIGGYWRTLIVSGVTWLVTVGISLWLFGAGAWLAFLGALDKQRLSMESGSLPLQEMISVFAALRTHGASAGMAYLGHAVVALVFVAVMVVIWRLSRDPALRASSLVLASLMATPYVYEYELPWLAAPLLLMAVRGRQHGWLPWQRELLALGWVLPIICIFYFSGAILLPIFEMALMYLVAQSAYLDHTKASLANIRV